MQYLSQYKLPHKYEFGIGGAVVYWRLARALPKLIGDISENLEDNILEHARARAKRVKKAVEDDKWMLAWDNVNALCIILDAFADEFHSLEDKKAIKLTNMLFGACVVKTLHGLDALLQYAVEDLPDLELGLERIVQWGTFAETRLHCKSVYLKVVKGLGAKLFGDRYPEERRRMWKARVKAYERFLQSIPDTHEGRKREDWCRLPNGEFLKNGDAREEDFDPWRGAKKKDVAFRHTDFDFELAFRVVENLIIQRRVDEPGPAEGSEPDSDLSDPPPGSDSEPDNDPNGPRAPGSRSEPDDDSSSEPDVDPDDDHPGSDSEPEDDPNGPSDPGSNSEPDSDSNDAPGSDSNGPSDPGSNSEPETDPNDAPGLNSEPDTDPDDPSDSNLSSDPHSEKDEDEEIQEGTRKAMARRGVRRLRR